MAKERTTKITPLIKLRGGLAPQASPMISEPKFGRRNSALETVASNFTLSNILVPTPNKGGHSQKRTFKACIIITFCMHLLMVLDSSGNLKNWVRATLDRD